jgi:hypothetical protein
LQRSENPGLRELNFHFARQQTGFDLDQPPEFFFGPYVWIQMFKRLPYSRLNYFHNLTEKRRPAKTIEHDFLGNPSILLNLREFRIDRMRSHRKENRFVDANDLSTCSTNGDD